MCNIKVDKNNCLKNRTVRKICYNKNTRKNNNNNTSIQNQQPKSDNNNDDDKKKRKVVNSMNLRTLIIGFSNSGKTYLMNHILDQKQESKNQYFYNKKITKSLSFNQSSNIR